MSAEKIFTISELIDVINEQLSEEVVVEGEISRIDIRQGNLIFITIKDTQSAIDIFGLTFRIRNVDVLEEGMQVRVYGMPGLYKKSGRFRVEASAIVPSGEGALRIAYEKLKLKLEQEGLFEVERKRPTKRFPERIAFITAPGSQAYKDFVKVLQERMGGMKVDFYPVQVQGQGSVTSIMRVLERISAEGLAYDAVVLARGGGSLEDLESFNNEDVARAVFSSHYPVICGVGHEGDVSLCDLVADIRASTPSNAAELLVPERVQVLQEITYSVGAIEQGMQSTIEEKRHAIRESMHAFEFVAEKERTRLTIALSTFGQLFSAAQSRVEMEHQNCDYLETQLIGILDDSTASYSDKVQHLSRYIKAQNPDVLLKRGYSIVKTKHGKIVVTSSDVKKNDMLDVTLSQGKLSTKVIRKQS